MRGRSPITTARPSRTGSATPTVAAIAKPALDETAARLPLAVRWWDGSETQFGEPHATIVVRSPQAVRRLLYQPNELGLSRAFVAGEVDVEGDIFALLDPPAEATGLRRRAGARTAVSLWRAALRLRAVGLPMTPPPEEARLAGGLHSRRRDERAISHHYDVGNDFYRLVLGESMVYSCGYWPQADATLDEAQDAKHELICRKLGLQQGMRLLDVGCGWGGLVIHAARTFGVSALGVTLSREQERLARERVAAAGLADRVEIRRQDYRELRDESFEAISSVGMFEHVGAAQTSEYFDRLGALLKPGGRLLNHAISRPSGEGEPAIRRNSFMGRYVFPDGALLEVGAAVSAMQNSGLEVRDVESLREHYVRTLRAWVANLERHREDAEALAGAPRTRIWRLYMAASAVAFERNRLSVHQVLAVRPDNDGSSRMPATRAWLAQ
ncbi:MAG: cyclopropane-fatty-acyl-phospholipid synthase [Gaiellales bacterium]|nr:cyclopropane-fatty-acyl-phospholipid synthase [Gaiellales bacterium]